MATAHRLRLRARSDEPSLAPEIPPAPHRELEFAIQPPFASVDIPASSTTALQQFPLVDSESNPYQLTKDTVKISIFGLRNHDALNFVQYVFQYSLNTDNIGMMNMPIIQDEKVTQPEFGIIAMKKSITFEVSYYQTTVNNIARKLIESAFINLNPI